MSETALVTTNGDRMVTVYGQQEAVTALVERMMTFHPAASEVGREGMLMAAELAVMIGASPLPSVNEIHIYKDKGGVKVAPGQNWWQRRAEGKGGVRWVFQARPMTKEERDAYGIPNGVFAAICKGMRAVDYTQARREGMTFAQAENACSYIGIGTAAQSEYAKNGRPAVWTAIKRALKDFYSQAFPWTPGEQFDAGAGMKRTADGYYAPTSFIVGAEPTGKSLAELNGELFGDDPAGPEWEEGAFEAGEEMEAVEGEYEEEPAADQEIGETDPLPMDWIGQAENAKDLDVFSSAAYQLLKQVFTDAPGVRRAYGRVCGDFRPENNRIALAAMGKLAQALGDGVRQADAIKMAATYFTKLLQPDEQPTAAAEFTAGEGGGVEQ